jgi:hypothetical protein
MCEHREQKAATVTTARKLQVLVVRACRSSSGGDVCFLRHFPVECPPSSRAWNAREDAA